MSSRAWAPVFVLLISMLAMLDGTVSHEPSHLRTLAMVCFLAIAPGLGCVGVLRLSDRWLRAALVPAVSLSIDAIVGGALSYIGLWSPSAAILVIVALTVAGALAEHFVRSLRRAG